jgi:hypothetical protein
MCRSFVPGVLLYVQRRRLGRGFRLALPSRPGQGALLRMRMLGFSSSASRTSRARLLAQYITPAVMQRSRLRLGLHKNGGNDRTKVGAGRLTVLILDVANRGVEPCGRRDGLQRVRWYRALASQVHKRLASLSIHTRSCRSRTRALRGVAGFPFGTLNPRTNGWIACGDLRLARQRSSYVGHQLRRE